MLSAFGHMNLGAGSIKLHHSIPLRVLHHIGKERGAVVAVPRAVELLLQALAVENVIAQNEGDVIVTDVVTTKNEGLGQAFGVRLDSIGQRDAEARPVPEHALK